MTHPSEFVRRAEAYEIILLIITVRTFFLNKVGHNNIINLVVLMNKTKKLRERFNLSLTERFQKFYLGT